MDAFDFPDLVPDEEPDEHPEELHNVAKRVRYCYLKTERSRETRCTCGNTLVAKKRQETITCTCGNTLITKRPQESPACPCGNTSVYRYGNRTHSYRDLPRLQDRTVLVIRRQRYKCRKKEGDELACGETFVQKIAGLDSDRSMTTRCLEWIRANCLRYSSEDIADHIGCDPRTVREIAYERIRVLKATHRRYLPVWLGIDETYFKGHINTRCCVFVDLEQRRPIDLIDSRPIEVGHKQTKSKKSGPTESELVRQWLKQFSDSDHLAGVAMDMSENFRRVVREVFPDAEIVADRYHVEKWANIAVDRVRDSTEKQLRRKLKKGWDTEEWTQKSRLLRKHRGQMSDGNDLTKRDKSPAAKQIQKERDRQCEEEFLRWLSLHPKLEIAYGLKESFCNIYNNCQRRYEARKALRRWTRRFPEDMRGPFKEVLRATREWRREFLAYFPVRKSNGYTEAFNSVLKRINRGGNNYSFDVLWAKAIYGRKPEHETVMLRPPSLEQFALDSQPVRELCHYCGQEYSADETADPEETFGRFITFSKVDDKWIQDGCWRCPICDSYMMTEASKPVVPAAKFSVEYLQDVGVGDDVSASRFAGNFCASCGNPFNADQLFDLDLDFLDGRPGEFLVCANCRDKDLEQGKKTPFATANDVKGWWMAQLKDCEFATESGDEKSEGHEDEVLELGEVQAYAPASALTDSMAVDGPCLTESITVYAPEDRGRTQTRRVPDAAMIESELNPEPGTENTGGELNEAKVYAFPIASADGCPAVPTDPIPATDQRIQNPEGSKRSKRRPPLVRNLARDLRPTPKAAQLSFDFLR
ncbi:MAG: ISL3 family transposase [Terracidiphilus sp.]